MAPDWEAFAKAVHTSPPEELRDINVKIAEVDATVHKDAKTFGEVKGFPTIKLYHKGVEVEKYGG